MNTLQEIVSKQREFFASTVTLSVAFRKNSLQRLLHSFKSHKASLLQALAADLGKGREEALIIEVAPVVSSIKEHH